MSELEPYGGPWQQRTGRPVGDAPPMMSSVTTTTGSYPVPYVSPYPMPYAPSVAPLVTDQRPASGGLLAVAWLTAIFTLGYMLPWAIAASRGRSNQGAVGLLNFFLGWTFFGWIVALVMACESHAVFGHSTQSVTMVMPTFVQTSTHVQNPAPPAGWYPVPNGTSRQYWDGTAWTGHRAP